MRSIILATALFNKVAVGDFQPCSQSSKACCDPHQTIPQLCPDGEQCQLCGAGSACECPGQTPPGPTPPPTPAPTHSTTRLKIVNGCDSPIWIAHIVANGIGPDPQDVKISPGSSAKFRSSMEPGSGALSATRFWPKTGCDETGNKCSFGDSGGPGEGCVIRIPGKDDDYSHCAPPVDTKFEATFGPPGPDGHDVLDMSLVDGYSLPFKLEVTGGTCIREGKPFEEMGMDCSGLSLSKCPTAEKLNGQTLNLQATNPKTGKLAGCFSPCMKLTDDKWNTGGVAPDSAAAGPYCCAGADGSPQSCKAGPILQTEYLKAVKELCPAAYGYAYDDKSATIACSTTSEYTVTFYCPVDAPAEDVQVV